MTRTPSSPGSTLLRRLTVAAALAIAVGLTGGVGTAAAARSAQATVPASVDALVVAPEGPRTGYLRSLFVHWIDADGNGCDTRCEVLRRQRRTDLPGLASGWLSIYDGYTTPNPSELDIDHVVALAEAWDSGAAQWDSARRQAFANDLTERRALIAVTRAENIRKSDKDPAEWQPSNRDSWCEFADAWVAVKVRWGLTADPAEVRALTNMLRGCPDGTRVTPVPAVPVAAPGSNGTPTATAGTTATGEPYYPNCTAARAAGVAPILRGQPGYRTRLDGDGDGVACE